MKKLIERSAKVFGWISAIVAIPLIIQCLPDDLKSKIWSLIETMFMSMSSSILSTYISITSFLRTGVELWILILAVPVAISIPFLIGKFSKKKNVHLYESQSEADYSDDYYKDWRLNWNLDPFTKTVHNFRVVCAKCGCGIEAHFDRGPYGMGYYYNCPECEFQQLMPDEATFHDARLAIEHRCKTGRRGQKPKL